MTEANSETTELVAALRASARYVMPVRLMEELIDEGAAAAPALRDLLAPAAAPHAEDDPDGLPWLCAILVLGEMRDAAAARLLAGVVRHAGANELPLRLAAAEALASVGEPALDVIRELATSSESRHRLWAYYALGRVPGGAAASLLLEALERDVELADLAASALADRGDRSALEPIYRALLRAPDWQRMDFEQALRGLHDPDATGNLASDDWRLRYRLNQAKMQHPLNWAAIADLVFEEGGKPRHTPPLRPIEEILAQPDDSKERCECCDVETWTFIRLPVCPQTAVAIPRLLARRLDAYWADEPNDDAFDLIDAIEADLLELMDEPVPAGRRAREMHQDRIIELQLMLQGAMWSIERGAECVDDILKALEEEGDRAASLWGEPDEPRERRPTPSPAPAPTAPVGRNDPCPCGSGRKSKKCHGDPSGSR